MCIRFTHTHAQPDTRLLESMWQHHYRLLYISRRWIDNWISCFFPNTLYITLQLWFCWHFDIVLFSFCSSFHFRCKNVAACGSVFVRLFIMFVFNIVWVLIYLRNGSANNHECLIDLCASGEYNRTCDFLIIDEEKIAVTSKGNPRSKYVHHKWLGHTHRKRTLHLKRCFFRQKAAVIKQIRLTP